MMGREIPKYCLDLIKSKGMEHSEAIYTITKKYEFNINFGKVALLRTIESENLDLKAIEQNKKGVISLSNVEEDTLLNGIEELVQNCEMAQEDENNSIAPYAPSETFVFGYETPDLKRMLQLTSNFANDVKERFPKIILGEAYLFFTHTREYFMNSNGVDYTTEKGVYKFSAGFTAKEGTNTSSFNHSFFTLKNLDKEIMDQGDVAELMEQSVNQIHSQILNDKFKGDVILTPDALDTMVNFYLNSYLRENSIITGSSKLKNSLNEKIASEKLTIKSLGNSEELSDARFVTSDGYKCENLNIIESGILRSFLLNSYAGAKSGLGRSKNYGEFIVVDGGEKSLGEIIKDTKKGIILGRFSGANPSANGDFSGVAKNSFYVENGEVKFAISETMISGNLYEMFNEIEEISKDKVEYGHASLPWIKCNNIMIVGKN